MTAGAPCGAMSPRGETVMGLVGKEAASMQPDHRLWYPDVVVLNPVAMVGAAVATDLADKIDHQPCGLRGRRPP